MQAQGFCQEREREQEQEKEQEEQFTIATFQVGTLPLSLTPSNGSASFAIGSRPLRSSHRCESIRFDRDIIISMRSAIYPMGRHFVSMAVPILASYQR